MVLNISAPGFPQKARILKSSPTTTEVWAAIDTPSQLGLHINQAYGAKCSA